MMLCSFMGGVSFPGVPTPVVRWLRTEGYTAFSSFTHSLTLPLHGVSDAQALEYLDDLHTAHAPERWIRIGHSCPN